MALVRWEPARELASLQQEVNRLFGTFFDAPGGPGAGPGAARAVDPGHGPRRVRRGLRPTADLPGLAEADVKLEVEDGVLTISGERARRARERARGLVRVERAFGAFRRSLTLPDGVDPEQVTARFDRGVLEVRIPKPEHRKPRKVAIRVGDAPTEIEGRERPTAGASAQRRPGLAGRAARAARRAGPGHAGRARPADAARRRSARLPAWRAAWPDPATRVPPPPSRSRPAIPARAPARASSRPRTATCARPAFVPLATKATVKSARCPARSPTSATTWCSATRSTCSWSPGHELIARLRRPARASWAGTRPIITDSGGFQVFSMGHGTVADEIKGRAPIGADAPGRASSPSRRRACASAPTSTAPSASWARRRRWRSRPRWAPTSRSSSTSARPSTSAATTPPARPSARTAGCERCLDWHAAHGPDRPARLRDRPGRRPRGPAGRVGARGRRQRASTASPSAARSAPTRPQMHEVVGWTTAALGGDADATPRHLLGIGEVDDLVRGVELGIDTFDCAMPTRLARHGMALVPDPAGRWRVDLAKARWRLSDEPLMDGCPCPACAAGLHPRLPALPRPGPRARPAMRLLTLHNLAFVARLMRRPARRDRHAGRWRPRGAPCSRARRSRRAVARRSARVVADECCIASMERCTSS